MSTPTTIKDAAKHPDVVIQKVLLIIQLLLFLSVVGIVFGLLMMMAIGAYQVLSTLYFASAKQSAWHLNYLKGLLVYTAVTVGLSYGASFGLEEVSEFLVFVLLTFIPYGLSIYYYFGSKRYHEVQELVVDAPFRDKDILDDFMMD